MFNEMFAELEHIDKIVKDYANGIISVEIRNKEPQVHMMNNEFIELAHKYNADIALNPTFGDTISKTDPSNTYEQYEFRVGTINVFTIMQNEEAKEYGLCVRT